MILHKVSAVLNTSGYKTKIRDFEVKATTKSYVCDIENLRISKDKIMLIDTIMIENHRCINYFIYCLENQTDEALNMLKKHITEKANIYKSEIDLIYQHINSHI